jgi:hypothetical protein
LFACDEGGKARAKAVSAFTVNEKYITAEGIIACEKVSLIRSKVIIRAAGFSFIA